MTPKAFAALMADAVRSRAESDDAENPWRSAELLEFSFPGKAGMAIRVGDDLFLVHVTSGGAGHDDTVPTRPVRASTEPPPVHIPNPKDHPSLAEIEAGARR